MYIDGESTTLVPKSDRVAPVTTRFESVRVRQPRRIRPTRRRSTQARARWMGRYQALLVVLDLVAVFTACVVASSAHFGDITQSGTSARIAVTLSLGWIAALAVNRAYEGRFVGVGPDEFARVLRAALHLAAVLAFASCITRSDLVRSYVFVLLGGSLPLDVLSRYAARKWLHRRRLQGRSLYSVLAVGEPTAVAAFAVLLTRDRYAGMRVRAACVTGACPTTVADELEALGVSIEGGVDSVVDSATAIGAHTVAVVSTGDLGADRLRWISWQLEGTDIDLVVSPGLTEIAGPRLHIRPVAGLPLLHVEEPEFRGFRRFVKATVDRALAALALILLLPLFAALYVAVRVTSRGPGFFRQTRIGRDGRPFTMLKFRSMVIGAESVLDSLAQSNVNADGLLFKVRSDPRVTRVGQVLRRYSMDELPQLVNVLVGHMSLVGPRPPLPSEVACYEATTRRRLLVKPGLTGLWQVSGRSDLSWEESVRLDLRYVENWSPMLDLMILWKTAFAVIRAAGAY
jgi:exopolysaccharide biosynthesis polyprenyl glycosylphosphotransferase